MIVRSVFALAALAAGNAWASAADASVIDYAKLSVGQSLNTEIEGFGLADGFSYGAGVGKDFGPVRCLALTASPANSICSAPASTPTRSIGTPTRT